MNAFPMIVPIDDLIAEHNSKTGDKMTRSSLARELVKNGDYKTFQSAVNAIAYMASGKSKGLDYAFEKYLCKRFDKKLSEIFKD